LQWLREMRVILFQCRTLRAKVAFEHIYSNTYKGAVAPP
jgi:hypothetical protein